MPTPCANGCPFYGTPQTNNLCSACFRMSNANSTCSNEKCPKGAPSSSTNLTATVAAASSVTPPAPPSPPPAAPVTPVSTTNVGTPSPLPPFTSTTTASAPAPLPPAADTDPAPLAEKPAQLAAHVPEPPPKEPALATATRLRQATATRSPDDGRPAKRSNRCFVCRKKLGLTPFVCKCDQSFCPRHRMPSEHDCPFDFKAQQRSELARANPAVVAKKVDKI